VDTYVDAAILPALLVAFVVGRLAARRGFRAARDAWAADRTLLERRVEELRERGRTAGATIERLERTLVEIPEIAQRLISVGSLREIPECALDLAMELFHPGYAVFYRNGRGGLVAVAARGGSEFSRGHRLQMGEGIVGWAAERQATLTEADAEAAPARVRHEQLQRCWPRGGFSVALPLAAGSETLGVILIGPCSRQLPTREIGRTLALVTSVAITSASVLQRERKMARTDGLTGLLNKTHLLGLLDATLRADRGRSRPISVFLFDIDHFKTFNDTNGHLAGDELLQELAGLLQRSVREGDHVGRYGGEEFVVVMPGANKRQALEAAERIRRAIDEHKFPHQASQPGGSVTISGGVASWPSDGDDTSLLLRRADEALYQSKAAGRNCVHAWVLPDLAADGATAVPAVRSAKVA